MNTYLLLSSAVAAFIWLIILGLPWRPWLNGETLEPTAGAEADLSNLTVLIPARDEAETIGSTLKGIASQGNGIKVVLVDDGSVDGTANIARQIEGISLTLVEGSPLPSGWSGKLWALEQGLREVATPWVLLLDADIQLKPGMALALLEKAKSDKRSFVSIMASLRMETFWESLLMPAFIYFFKLLYPFGVANSDRTRFAAAAGGCILLETRVIREIGGFSSIKEALIDDCALACKAKRAGNRIWVGQSRSVISLRAYDQLEPIWEMVARSAFTQLRYSGWLLALCTCLMLLLFLAPVAGIVWFDGWICALSFFAFGAMAATYVPALSYYGKSPLWACLLPAIACLYLAMTWTSALRYWRGARSRWKNRTYTVEC